MELLFCWKKMKMMAEEKLPLASRWIADFQSYPERRMATDERKRS